MQWLKYRIWILWLILADHLAYEVLRRIMNSLWPNTTSSSLSSSFPSFCSSSSIFANSKLQTPRYRKTKLKVLADLKRQCSHQEWKPKNLGRGSGRSGWNVWKTQNLGQKENFKNKLPCVWGGGPSYVNLMALISSSFSDFLPTSPLSSGLLHGSDHRERMQRCVRLSGCSLFIKVDFDFIHQD